jgi:hypothetical protein
MQGDQQGESANNIRKLMTDVEMLQRTHIEFIKYVS